MFSLYLDLHSEFRTVPLATRGIMGEPATLECEPPRGHPEPQVRWKKNGQLLELTAVGQHRDHSARYKKKFYSLLFSQRGKKNSIECDAAFVFLLSSVTQHLSLCMVTYSIRITLHRMWSVFRHSPSILHSK